MYKSDNHRCIKRFFDGYYIKKPEKIDFRARQMAILQKMKKDQDEEFDLGDDFRRLMNQKHLEHEPD